MKYISPLLFFSVLLLSVSSCEKEENEIYYEDGTAPVLTASAADVNLEPGLESNTALALNWTNPDYIFTTGISSHDVTYTLEMDTMGANFSSSKKYTSVIAKELSRTYTVGQLNAILGNDMLLQLNPRRNYTLELRVISSIGSAAKLISNVVSFTTKPFAPPPTVVPPASGKLYLVGSATPGGDATGWDNPVPTPSQEFTQVSPTFYELTIPLIADKSYLFLPVNGSWSAKYGGVGANNANNVNGDNFKAEGGDLKSPGVSGNYKIEVDFQLGKFKVTKL